MGSTMMHARKYHRAVAKHRNHGCIIMERRESVACPRILGRKSTVSDLSGVVNFLRVHQDVSIQWESREAKRDSGLFYRRCSWGVLDDIILTPFGGTRPFPLGGTIDLAEEEW